LKETGVTQRSLSAALVLVVALAVGCSGNSDEMKVKAGSNIDTSIKPESMRKPAGGGGKAATSSDSK
jgi:hypothetical protein